LSAASTESSSNSSSNGFRPLGLLEYSLAAQMLATLGAESVTLVLEDEHLKTALHNCGVKVRHAARQLDGISVNSFKSLHARAGMSP
jgi:GTP cyclohydrolase II